MRLSLMKAAHAGLGGATWQEIRVAHLFRPMYAPRQAGAGKANMGTRPIASGLCYSSEADEG
jgi:hypothetical protein